jgi:hypothetical protein
MPRDGSLTLSDIPRADALDHEFASTTCFLALTTTHVEGGMMVHSGLWGRQPRRN